MLNKVTLIYRQLEKALQGILEGKCKSEAVIHIEESMESLTALKSVINWVSVLEGYPIKGDVVLLATTDMIIEGQFDGTLWRDVFGSITTDVLFWVYKENINNFK